MEQRGLADAGSSLDREEVALFDREVDAAQDRQRRPRDLERPGDSAHLVDRRACQSSLRHLTGSSRAAVTAGITPASTASRNAPSDGTRDPVRHELRRDVLEPVDLLVEDLEVERPAREPVLDRVDVLDDGQPERQAGGRADEPEDRRRSPRTRRRRGATRAPCSAGSRCRASSRSPSCRGCRGSIRRRCR